MVIENSATNLLIKNFTFSNIQQPNYQNFIYAMNTNINLFSTVFKKITWISVYKMQNQHLI